MKTLRSYSLLLLLLCSALSASAQLTPEQEAEVASLKKVIKSAKHDTTIVNAWKAWDDIIYVDDPKLDFELNRKIDSLCAVNLKKKLTKKERDSFLDSQGFALNSLGLIYMYQGDNAKAVDYYTQSLNIQKKLGDKEGIANTLNNIGLVYNEQGDYAKAIDNYNQSLKIQKEIGDKKGKANTLNNIGNIYYSLGDFAKAIDYYTQSSKTHREIGNKEGIAMSLNNIGNIYYDKGDFAKAINNYTRSLNIEESLRNKAGIATALNNIGGIYYEQGDYTKAYDYYIRGLKLEEELGDKQGIAGSLISIVNIHNARGEYAKALSYGSRALSLAQEIGAALETKLAAQSLWETNKSLGRYKEALAMYELYIKTKDGLESEENQKELIRQEYKSNYEKEAAADSVAFAKQKEITDVQLEKQTVALEARRNQQYALGAGLVLIALFAFFMYNRFKVTRQQKVIIEETNEELNQTNAELAAQRDEIEKQKEVVEKANQLLGEKNQEIMDSITYAKRIQSAILPSAKRVSEHLNEHFILYKPKDVVAGDFYWLEQTHNTVLFAAADCTGHGVPGAMVSVVCHNALNRSVREHGLTDPGEILTKTREIVIQEFAKSEEDVKDGMDIALCALEGNKLHYAGANNPLWIIRKGEIIETKANKQPIGQFDNPVPYNTHLFELEKGDTIYIFSDGYMDQFGGEKGKKFTIKAFRELILSIQDKSMDAQKRIIDEAFETWKGALEQVDDVCIIGVRVEC